MLWVESEKAGLKLNIKKTKIIASGPITLWQIGGEKVERVADLFSSSPKSLWMVTAVMKLKDLEEQLFGRKTLFFLKQKL